MAPENGTPPGVAAAVSEISERASLLIREEIELAKAEINQKITSLIKGAVVALAAGMFLSTALLFILHGFAWFFSDVLFNYSNLFWGFFIVAAGLFALAVLAGFLAWRWFQRGAPPTPDMAIEEARLIRETMTGEEPAAVAAGGPGYVAPGAEAAQVGAGPAPGGEQPTPDEEPPASGPDEERS